MTEENLARLKKQIAERLRPLCETWPAAAFDAMVDQIASITLKYEHGSGVTAYDRRATERMVEEMKALTRRNEDA